MDFTLNWYFVSLVLGVFAAIMKFVHEGIKTNTMLHSASQKALTEIQVKLDSMFTTHKVVDDKIKSKTDEIYEEIENVETRTKEKIEELKTKIDRHIDKTV